jgi:hypothetical protein
VDGLRFVIYDKAESYKRKLVGLTASAELIPNGISTAEFAIDDDHIAVADIVAEGARCAVWFRGKEQFRGRISATPGAGPEGEMSVLVEGDMRKFWDWYGRQVPGAPLNAQTSEYRVYTGKSEAVFKAAVAENFARLGVPWTVAADHGYGTDAKAEFRMHPLADKLFPLLEADDLLVTLSYPGGTAVQVDVREAMIVPGKLTLKSGVLNEYEYTRVAPDATRVTVGGRGEGVAREFVEVIDTAREAAWGDIIETFVDARNTEVGADLSKEGKEALEEAAARVGVTTELVESPRFRFGTTFDVGDLVSVNVGPVESIEPISVSIDETPSRGVLVTPFIGSADVSADTDVALATAVARLARGVRDSGRR